MAGNATFKDKSVQPIRTYIRRSGEQRCKACDKNVGAMVTCKLCGIPWHPLCAYFNGQQLKVSKQGPVELSAEVTCCRPGKESKQLSFYRQTLTNCKSLIKFGKYDPEFRV